MKISVRFFTRLREITGKREETLTFPEDEDITLERVVSVLAEKYGKDFADYVYDPKTCAIREFLQFLVNGRNAEDVSTSLSEGDLLAIIPPVGGG
ncbi:TPA: MoaD family protein [Candidatus Bathyarchaeota archaeon]|nr:MoaD family protein [Candidatus Bathyarchaeota archaeon]HIJ08715.1 MoaD family protein [Candidatus Bathyarchaeota archaeon]